MTWAIQPLSPKHERGLFRCGKQDLDDYIQKYAGQQMRKNLGRTFVAVLPGTMRVLGYYTLSSSSVAFQNLPDYLKSKMPRYPLPIVLLGRLAVDQSVQGKRLGEHLLIDALRRTVEVSSDVALYGVEVHAIDDPARSFYARYGFEVFADHPLHLFLPLDTIKLLF